MLLGGLPNHQTTPINETNMSKKRHTKEAQIKAIRDHESGRSQAEICKKLNILTKSMALEWALLGITVNAVAPTYLMTPGTRPHLEKPSSVNPSFHASLSAASVASMTSPTPSASSAILIPSSSPARC